MKSFLYSLVGTLMGIALGVAGIAFAANTTLPNPAINGPYLGDSGNNLYTLTQSFIGFNGLGAAQVATISQSSGQSNCTQLGNLSALHQLETSASTGYVCLPTAIPGKMLVLGNATGQTIDLYSSAVSYVSGTADDINGTVGTTPYTGLTSGKSAVCFVPVGGLWYCGSIS